MDKFTLNVSLLSPVSDLIAGAGVNLDLIFGRGGNDIFYSFDPLEDAKPGINIDILFGDLFDNTPEEFQVTSALAGFATGTPDPFAILNPNLPNIPSIGRDRFVLGDEFQPYYTSFDPFSLLTTNAFGLNEFAVIYDFDPTQDTIQLNGKKDDYFLLKINALSVSAITGGASQAETDFSGYGLFSLQTGLPDLVSLIAQKPSVQLDLKNDAFQFVGNKPKDKPQDKKIGQFGTTGLDYGYATTIDAAGNLYVVGSTSGSLNGANKGSSDVWVTKYAANGTKLWDKQYGSAGGETAYEIITDAQGNFYMAGSTSGSFVAGLKSTRGTDAWVAKYDSNGNKLWGRQFGSGAAQTSPGDEFGFSTSGFGLQLDANGDVYLSGLTINDNYKGILDFPVEDDSWIIKLNGATGANKWTRSTTITPPAKDVDPNFPFLASVSPFFDESYDLATDAQGNSYLVGWSQGLTTISDPNRDLQKYDAWVSKVDTTGKIEWVRQFGTVDFGAEFGWTVDTDSKGNVYISGWTTGAKFNGEVSGDFAKAAERDVFLAKFSSAGDLAFVKRIGSAGDDGQFFSDMFIDENDNIFLTGYTDDKLGKGKADGTINAWIGRFDTNGTNKWIQQIGVKDKADYATGVTARNGKVFVTGFTEGFLGTSNTTGAKGAAIDGWLAQLDVEKGKLQKFEGNSGSAISITDPGPISTPDITSRFAVGDDLPRGTRNTPNPGPYYGDILGAIAPAFNPNSANSLQQSLKTSGILNNSMLDRSTKVDYKGTDNDDVYFGGSAEDKLEGKKGNDVLYGRGGNDEVKGDEGNDILYGGDGNDKIEGGDQDDILYGGAGNDEVKGGKGMDTLTGVDPDSTLAGSGEIDKLKGEDGADLFVLGDASRAYYTQQGNRDYALIEDFEIKELDKIQLSGNGSYTLRTDVSGLPKGTAILLGNELIGIVKDVKGLSLSDSRVFRFVPTPLAD